MKVNTGKTFASGILHAEAGRLGGHKQVAGMLERRLSTVRVQGRPVQTLPSDAPFLYLGVTMTLTMNWKHHFENVIRKAKEQAQSVRASWATGGQRVKLAETVVRPGVTSSFCVAPFTPLHIRMLDGVLVGMYKQAYGQRRSTPTAAVHEDVSRFGLGCRSLLVEYVHESTKQYTEAYNDGGAYGAITRALVARQNGGLGGLTASELGARAMRHLRIRQLSTFAETGLTLVKTSTGETVELEGTDLQQVVAAVRAAAGTQLAAVVTQKVLLPLIDVGVEYITDVLSRDCTKVLSAADLRKKYGSRVRTKHIQALHKLAHLLHDPAPSKVCNDKAQLSADAMEAMGIRAVAAEHLPILTAPYMHPLGQVDLRNMAV
jgi:hypothetical protein